MSEKKRSDRIAITREEYLQLIGLKALSDQHNRDIQRIVRAAIEITGELDDDGDPATERTSSHCSDTYYLAEPSGPGAIDDMLKKIGLKVSE